MSFTAMRVTGPLLHLHTTDSCLSLPFVSSSHLAEKFLWFTAQSRMTFGWRLAAPDHVYFLYSVTGDKMFIRRSTVSDMVQIFLLCYCSLMSLCVYVCVFRGVS